MSTGKKWKKVKSGEPDVEIDYELINNWTVYAKQLGLTDIETLGMAYFIAAIPTVTSIAKEDISVLTPLQKVVSNFMHSSDEGANILYIYREFYFNASIKSSEIEHIKFEGLQEDFFFEINNKYQKYSDQEDTLFNDSGLTLDFIGNIGKILFDYKINISQAFNLGHQHTNFLLEINFYVASKAIIFSNILPEYLATLVECIPKPDSLALRSDLWLFSKVLQLVLGHEEYDKEFEAWIWYYHNSLFYENKPGSLKIKKEWDLEKPDFERKMLLQINQTIFSYYKSNRKTGNQSINRTLKLVNKIEDYFGFINEKMLDSYSLEIDRKNFRNIGEKTNYLCLVFIKAIEVSFEKFKFGEVWDSE